MATADVVSDMWDVTPTWWVRAVEEGDSARIGEAMLRLFALENMDNGLLLGGADSHEVHLSRDLADHSPSQEELEEFARHLEDIAPRNADPDRSTFEE